MGFQSKTNLMESLMNIKQVGCQWYTEKPGIDCEDTYSPVIKFISVRTLMAIVVKLNLGLY